MFKNVYLKTYFKCYHVEKCFIKTLRSHQGIFLINKFFRLVKACLCCKIFTPSFCNATFSSFEPENSDSNAAPNELNIVISVTWAVIWSKDSVVTSTSSLAASIWRKIAPSWARMANLISSKASRLTEKKSLLRRKTSNLCIVIATVVSNWATASSKKLRSKSAVNWKLRQKFARTT